LGTGPSKYRAVPIPIETISFERRSIAWKQTRAASSLYRFVDVPVAIVLRTRNAASSARKLISRG
jgi:hypothetical protein